MTEIIKKDDKEWDAIFDDKLASNLHKTIEEALLNAEDLLEEANLLFDNKKYSRSAGLAILAEEEFAKCLILDDAIKSKTWNSASFKIIKKHNAKQAIAEYLSTNCYKIKQIEEESKFRHIPISVESIIFAESSENKEFESKLLKNTVNRNKREFYKQNMFYVNLGKTGALSNSPNKISPKDAAICLDYASRLNELTKISLELLQKKHLGNKFRKGSSLKTDHSTFWTISYDEYNLSLDIYNWNYSLPEEAKKKLSTFVADIRKIEEYLSNEEKKIPKSEINRCRKFLIDHNFLEQVQQQKKELKLRHSPLEEAIIFIQEST